MPEETPSSLSTRSTPNGDGIAANCGTHGIWTIFRTEPAELIHLRHIQPVCVNGRRHQMVIRNPNRQHSIQRAVWSVPLSTELEAQTLFDNHPIDQCLSDELSTFSNLHWTQLSEDVHTYISQSEHGSICITTWFLTISPDNDSSFNF